MRWPGRVWRDHLSPRSLFLFFFFIFAFTCFGAELPYVRRSAGILMPKRATVVRCSRLHVFKCIEQVDSSSLKRNVFVLNWVRMMGPIFVVRIFKWLEKSIWSYMSRQIGYGETRFLVFGTRFGKGDDRFFFCKGDFDCYGWLNADWFASFCVIHVDLIVVNKTLRNGFWIGRFRYLVTNALNCFRLVWFWKICAKCTSTSDCALNRYFFTYNYY